MLCMHLTASPQVAFSTGRRTQALILLKPGGYGLSKTSSVLLEGPASSTALLNLYFGWCLARLVRGGVRSNFTATLPNG